MPYHRRGWRATHRLGGVYKVGDWWRVTGTLDAKLNVAALELELRYLFLDQEFDEVFDLFLIHL